MTEKEIAKLVLAKVGEGETKIQNLKVEVEKLIKELLGAVKEITGEMPDEDTFFRVLSEIIDELLPLPIYFEPFDSAVAYKLLKILDKVLLDKLLGADWYKKLTSLVATV